MDLVDEELLLSVVERKNPGDELILAHVEKPTPIEIAQELATNPEATKFGELVDFYNSGMFKLLKNGKVDMPVDIFSLHRQSHSNLVLNTAQLCDQQQNVVREALCFRLIKSDLTDHLCDLVNLYECSYNNSGNKLCIPATLLALDAVCGLSNCDDATIIQIITFLMVMNAVIKEFRHSKIIENKSLISDYAIECHKSVHGGVASLNIEILTNNTKNSKMKVASLLAKCLNKEVLGRPKLILSYAVHICNIKCQSVIDLIKKYYSMIYKSIRFCFCYVGAQQDSTDKVLINCETLTKMGNEFNMSFLINVFNPVLSGAYDLIDIVSKNALPVIYVHRGSIVQQSVSTAKMLHTIFLCNNGFVVSRHNHCVILEAHSCAGSPQVSITTGGDCVRTKSGVNIYQRLSLDPKKKAVYSYLLQGLHTNLKPQRNNTMPRCRDELLSSDNINCNKMGYELFKEGEFIDTFQHALENCKLNFSRIAITKKLQSRVGFYLKQFIENTDDLPSMAVNCYLGALSFVVSSTDTINNNTGCLFGSFIQIDV